jgi:nucleotide-binding universal stress UspA family protein
VALPGEADDVIIKLAEEKGADLIVVGTHGRTGFGKVLLGSVCERVMGKAKCAVLVVKA